MIDNVLALSLAVVKGVAFGWAAVYVQQTYVPNFPLFRGLALLLLLSADLWFTTLAIQKRDKVREEYDTKYSPPRD